MEYTYDNYICDKYTIKSKLEEFGVAIIPKVLDSTEIKNMQQGMFKTFEHITSNFDIPFNKDDESTWKELFKLYPNHSMLYQHWQLGQSQFVWDIRQNKKIVDIFSKLWEVKNDELLTSYDGISFHVPHEVVKRGYFRNNNWCHVDQSYCRNDFECVQSWVTGYDIEDGDATLRFLENSNKYHREFGEKFNITSKSDWFKLEEDHYDFYLNEKKCRDVCIKCPAGSLVLWDSRTVHCGKEPDKNRPNKKFRNIVYLCMTPRKWCSNINIKKRIKAFEETRLTSHWPHKPKLFPKFPRTYGGDLPNVVDIEKPLLNDIGKKLVGY